MSSANAPKIEEHQRSKSEEELGAKWDRCLQDSLVKLGSGIGLGIVFSVVLFKSIHFYVQVLAIFFY